MVGRLDDGGVVQKHLGTIFSAQLFFSLLFGGLAFWMFYKLGRQFAEIISVIFGITDFVSHKMASVILATAAFIIVCFLVTYTVGAHYGMRKNVQSTIVGMLATSALAIMLISLTDSHLLIPILVLGLAIALFGFHSSNQIHESLRQEQVSAGQRRRTVTRVSSSRTVSKKPRKTYTVVQKNKKKTVKKKAPAKKKKARSRSTTRSRKKR